MMTMLVEKLEIEQWFSGRLKEKLLKRCPLSMFTECRVNLNHEIVLNQPKEKATSTSEDFCHHYRVHVTGRTKCWNARASARHTLEKQGKRPLCKGRTHARMHFLRARDMTRSQLLVNLGRYLAFGWVPWCYSQRGPAGWSQFFPQFPCGSFYVAAVWVGDIQGVGRREEVTLISRAVVVRGQVGFQQGREREVGRALFQALGIEVEE